MNYLYPVILAATNEAGTHAGGGFNIYTYLFSMLNLLILFYLLKLILFKPVTKIMKDRTEKIKSDIETARTNKENTEKLKVQYQKQLENIKEDSDRIISEARKKAQLEATQIIENAKRQAEQIIQKATERGDREVELALNDAKKQVTTLALQAASKVIEKNMDNETNRKIVEQFIEEVGAA